ncbi:MAG: cyclic nucleotide-binding domain-containing protein [Chloroflexota bacterium]
MNEKETTLTLAKIPLFHQLSSRQLHNLACIAVPREYPAGTPIVKQGENGIGLFVVIDGAAEAIRTHANGEQIVVNTFGPGDFFGEMALIDEGPRTASVVTTQTTRCLALVRWDFMSLLKTDTEMAVAILSELTRRFRIMLDVS